MEARRRFRVGRPAKPLIRAPSRSPATATAERVNSAPKIRSSREARAAVRSPPSAGRLSRRRLPSVTTKPIRGCAMASRCTASTAWPTSVACALRNFSRAGVAKNRSLASTRVPAACATGAGSALCPAVTSSDQPASSPGRRVAIESRETAAMDGRASPRKPNERMSSRTPSGSLEVAWRSTASHRSSRAMPQPSSLTEINARPPSRMRTWIEVAPASMLFSTSSLTTDAGRSTTSPAAILLTTASGSLRTIISPAVAAPCRR